MCLSWQDIVTEADIEAGRKKSRKWKQTAKEATFRLKAKTTTLRPWQERLLTYLRISPDRLRKIGKRIEKDIDRAVIYISDKVGLCGKSFLLKHLCDIFSDECIAVPHGKYDDMMHHLRDESSKSIIVINRPREDLFPLNTTFAENVKDGNISCHKYVPMKRREGDCHLVVMANRDPENLEALSADRWIVCEQLKDSNGEMDIYQRKYPNEAINKEKSNIESSPLIDVAVEIHDLMYPHEKIGSFSSNDFIRGPLTCSSKKVSNKKKANEMHEEEKSGKASLAKKVIDSEEERLSRNLEPNRNADEGDDAIYNPQKDR